MPRAIGDPQDMREFATALRHFNTELQDRMGRLKAQFNRLGETWRDQEQAKFAREFEQTMRVLNRFTQVADEHIPFLLRKAQRLEDYLRQS